MALSVFNPQTLENRPATPEEIAALYASPQPKHDESTAPESSESPSAFGIDPRSEGETSDAPSTEEPSEEPVPPVLGKDEVLIDWQTHVYDFATRQVLPIYVPLPQQLEEFKQHLLGEVATLRARLDTLAALATTA